MSEIKRVTIDSLSQHGEGIAHCEGKELYIEQALPGAEIEVEIGEPFARGSKRCPATCLRVLTSSPLETKEPCCPDFGRCGGCQIMHMQYADQLLYKRQSIKDAFVKAVKKLGGAKEVELLAAQDSYILPVVATEDRPCRFKSVRYFGEDESGTLVSGYFAARSHDLIAIKNCPLEPECFQKYSTELTQVLRDLGLHSAKGENSSAVDILRAMQLRSGDNDDVLLSLIVSAPLTQQQQSVIQSWAQQSGVKSFTIGLNTKSGNALFTKDHSTLAGSGSLQKTLLEKRFSVGPNTFLQVNYEICDKLYKAAVAHCIKSKSHDVALDLCCGVGTMSLALADHFTHVIGVEIVEDSIIAAKANAEANGISHVKFIAADIKDVLPSLVKSDNGAHIGAIIADPARVGLGESNARALAKIKTPLQLSLIYCSLTAMIRELPIFLKAGFTLEAIQGFDMFPHSTHVETLVLLSRA